MYVGFYAKTNVVSGRCVYFTFISLSICSGSNVPSYVNNWRVKTPVIIGIFEHCLSTACELPQIIISYPGRQCAITQAKHAIEADGKKIDAY